MAFLLSLFIIKSPSLSDLSTKQDLSFFMLRFALGLAVTASFI